MSQAKLLAVEDLCVDIFRAGVAAPVVSGVSFTIEAGACYALVGESGCGKSMTALALARLLPEAARLRRARVLLDGRDLTQLREDAMRAVRGRQLAMIFQEPGSSLNPVLSIGRQLGEVLALRPDLRADRAAQQREMLALLASVGIADGARRLTEYPFQLSGGMKQRVMIGMALAGNPRLLVADEPTTALDVTTQAEILELLRGLQSQRQMGLLLISHDLGIVASMAQHVGVMYAGEIVETAPTAAFFAAPRHPYAQRLFAALPDVTRRGAALATIPGQVPAVGAWPVGCRFAARCAQAYAACREQAPQAHEVAALHWVRCHLYAPGQGPIASAPVATDAPASASRTRQEGAAVLEAVDVKVHFPLRAGLFKRTVGQVRAVDGVSLSLRPGCTLALVGESGCGKTSVGKALLRLDVPVQGSVRLDGQEIVALSRRALRPLRRKMQMIFQDPFASLNPRLRVGEIIAEGMVALQVVRGSGARQQAVALLLEQVGLPAEAALRYPHEFSGGQRQRIAIARTLAVQPELIVCDEPTSALDVSVQAQILNLLRQLQDRLALSYLFITHNFAVVEYLAHEVAVMYLGRIVERGRVDDILRQPKHPYTLALLSAVPVPDPQAQRQRLLLAGEMPSAARPPDGCHFHGRCPQALAVCAQHYPQPTALSSTHLVACHLYPASA